MTFLRLCIISLIFSELLSAQPVGAKIKGTASDLETMQPLIGANVILTLPDKNDWLPYGAATDLHGRFLISNVPPGRYRVRVSYIGYQSFKSAPFSLLSDSTRVFSIHLDPYVGLSVEDAQEHIRQGNIKIYLLASMFPPSSAQDALAERYGFKIGNTGCTILRTERYDSAMIKYLEARNGKGWFRRFKKEWDSIK